MQCKNLTEAQPLMVNATYTKTHVCGTWETTLQNIYANVYFICIKNSEKLKSVYNYMTRTWRPHFLLLNVLK